MKNSILLLLSVLLLSSCSKVRIENCTRLQVKGKVVSDAAVDDVDISVRAGDYSDMSSVPGNAGLLGEGKTDENGNFDFTSLLASDRMVVIEINESLSDSNELSSAIFFNDQEQKELYNLGEVNLPKRIQFNLSVENTSGTSDTLIYNFSFQGARKFYIWEGSDYVEYDEGSNYISIYRQIPSDTIRRLRFNTRANTTIEFIYNLGENPQQKIEIPVNSDNTSYEFEY